MKRTAIPNATVEALIAEAEAGGAHAHPVLTRHLTFDEVVVFRDGGVIASVLKTAPRGLTVWLGEGRPVVQVGDAKEAIRRALKSEVLAPPRGARYKETPPKLRAASRAMAKKRKPKAA